MNKRLCWLFAIGLMVLAGCQGAPRGDAGDAADAGEGVMREFRGVWVATVANIDWPSKPGLPAEEQRRELLAILDMAKGLNLNAVVLQVRPAGDAFYRSELEPWSEYLTGEQGRDPGYDPLAFAVEEAHRRGLELHAWFNPYRVGHPSGESDAVASHISRTRPDLVRQYGNLLWLDPGEREAEDHTMAVILDVVRRYDIDGVHIDDYFYPYPQRDEAGALIDFPDDPSWARYRGGLSRDDWRRANVDRFVERMYREVKRTDPRVLVGISPFGIWRPGNPPQVKGMDQYAAIYADARKWLERGWCDYFTPQLYWTIRKPDQSFVALLEWWKAHNPKGRHLWPGLYTSRTADGSSAAFDGQEIRYQIEWSRILLPESPGHVHFSAKALMNNVAGVTETLRATVYASPAVPPETPWLPDRSR